MKKTLKGGDTMKKLMAIALSMVMFLACIPVVSATSYTDVITVQYYIQRFGTHMDEDDSVGSRDAVHFTPLLYKGTLTDIMRKTDHSVVYKKGVVSSSDVTAEAVDVPGDAEMIAKVLELYENNGYILSSNGKVVDWSKFSTDNYEIRWYVLKFEQGLPSCWHIDGVIVEKTTQKPIEIPTPDDPTYVPPEELPKEEEGEDETIDPFVSDFAYIYGYNDTTMAPENNLLRSEVSAMVHRLAKQNDRLDGFSYNAANDPIFPDTKDEWFRSGIEFINSKGGFTVQPGENVNPYVAVTRGEAFRIVCLGLGFTAKSDLTNEQYADILYNEGYVLGDDNGDLLVDKQLTRAEFCTIYNRIIGRDEAKLETADGEAVTAETYGFTDLDSSKWYYNIMLRATSAYDENGYVDLSLRDRRNNLDDYE